MPNIYLRHEQHGEKVCHSASEAQSDKANGWVEFDPAPPAPVVIEEPAPPAPVDPIPDPAPVVPDFLLGTPAKKKRPTA